jgi:hypothetical protein
MEALTYFTKEVEKFLLNKTISKVGYSKTDSANEQTYGLKLIEMELSDGTKLSVNGTLDYVKSENYYGTFPMITKSGKDVVLNKDSRRNLPETYNFFLFSQLAQVYKMIDLHTAYDLMFFEILKLWDKFRESAYFNDFDRSYYDCIISFFHNEE